VVSGFQHLAEHDLSSSFKGTPLYAAHFRPGQFVDVTAKT